MNEDFEKWYDKNRKREYGKLDEDIICKKCGRSVVREIVESSCGAFSDSKYTCTKCRNVYWVDGIDS